MKPTFNMNGMAGMAVLSDWLYVCGGITGSYTADCVSFDLNGYNLHWWSDAPLPTTLAYHGMVTYGEYIYVLGKIVVAYLFMICIMVLYRTKILIYTRKSGRLFPYLP